ncbi:MAG: GNAT family N-acetyltransferase [Flavobacteriales bacterium]|nr:GNAT family N-acetyltransferase [Flavobacteriales bacterium]MBX2958394.1 GNAT family N-acetyltransferase [Flavobacteriales bacterium]
MKLVSEHIYLRKVIPSDASIIFAWENNPENWEVSNTEKCFTFKEIEAFVNQPQEINLYHQIRFIICLNKTDSPIGSIDLFDYEEGKSVGVGVLIADKNDRNKGYAKEALKQLINYVRNELNVAYIFCNIFENNKPSIRLFEHCGFKFIEERLLEGVSVNYYELEIV